MCNDNIYCDVSYIYSDGFGYPKNVEYRNKLKKRSLTRLPNSDVYSYHAVVFESSKIPIKIWCKTHQSYFTQLVDNHFVGKCGCKECQKITRRVPKKYTTESFVTKANEVHEGFYDYSKLVYVNPQTKITVTCPKHGDFEVAPYSHLSGAKCYRCYRESTIKPTNETIQDFIAVHGEGRYDYSQMDHKSSTKKVKIICKYHPHTHFMMNPNSHLHGKGCPLCNTGSYTINHLSNKELSSPMKLYHVRIYGEGFEFEKIGVTKTTITRRFAGLSTLGMTLEVLDLLEVDVSTALTIEENIKRYLGNIGESHKVHHLKGTPINGWTECFRVGLIDLKKFSLNI